LLEDTLFYSNTVSKNGPFVGLHEDLLDDGVVGVGWGIPLGFALTIFGLCAARVEFVIIA
jgi:hypothetical protein